jgi:hypothetical protein
MSMIIPGQSTSRAAQRRWQMLALIILTFLTVVAITYVLLYTVVHVDLLHMFMSYSPNPNVLYRLP